MGASHLSWEEVLVRRAWEGWNSPVVEAEGISGEILDRAYRVCEAILRVHSRSFHLASALLPAETRRAIRVLYAFCRVTDDLVDREGKDREVRWARWRALALSSSPPTEEPVALAWAHVRTRYRIPRGLVEQFMDGVAHDLGPVRMETFEDLATYCYGVASTVGLMSMRIIGGSPEAIPFAVRLGIALQLTNILRDVGEDLEMGRLYLPLHELRAFGLSEEDLRARRVDSRWRAFMRFQIDRARQLYAEAWSGIALLPRKAQFAIAAAADLYRGILDVIERNDFDVFRQRAALRGWERLWRLIRLRWALRRGIAGRTA